MNWIRRIAYSDRPVALGPVPAELAHLEVARVADWSMAPTLPNGALVVFDPAQPHPEDGQMVVLRHGAERLVRWARRDPTGRMVFSVENEAIAAADLGEVRVEGVVLLHVSAPWKLDDPDLVSRFQPVESASEQRVD